MAGNRRQIVIYFLRTKLPIKTVLLLIHQTTGQKFTIHTKWCFGAMQNDPKRLESVTRG